MMESVLEGGGSRRAARKINAGVGGIGVGTGSAGANGGTAGSGFYFMGGSTEINLQVDAPDTQTYNDDIFTDAGLNKTGDGTLTINGNISGAGSVSNNDGGTLELSGSLTYLGDTFLNSGTIAISGSISNLGTGDIQANGGNLKLLGDVSSRILFNDIVLNEDLTIIQDGMLLGGNNAFLNGALSGDGKLTFQRGQEDAGVSLWLNGDNSGFTGDLKVVGPAWVIVNGPDALTQQNNVHLEGTGTLGVYNNFDAILGDLTGTGYLLINTGSTATVGTDNDAVFDGYLASTGGGDFVKTGSGSLTFTKNQALSNTGLVTVDEGALIGTIGAMNNRNIINNDKVIIDDNNDGTYSGVMSGTGSFTKEGTGTNTYSGGTNINGGAVAITNDNNLGDSSGTLSFNGGTLRTDASITSSRLVTLEANGGTINTNGFNSTFGGGFGGTGSFTKTGNGVLTLNGANTYSGDTNVLGGTLQLGEIESLSNTTNLFVDDGATFDLNDFGQTVGAISGSGNIDLGSGGLATRSDNNSTFSGVISGTGAFVKGGNSTLILSSNNTYSGGTNIIIGGTIAITNDNNLGDASGGIFLNLGTLRTDADRSSSRGITLGSNGGTINTNGFDSLWDGGLSGGGNLDISGGGKLELAGMGSHNGILNLLDGHLVVNGTYGSSRVQIASGSQFSGTGTISDLTNSGLFAPGNSIGTMTVNGVFSQTSDGTLQIEIDDLSATPVAGVNNDFVQVNGAAALDGVVDVVAASGAGYTHGMRYDFLTADSGLTGGFADITDNLAFFNAVLGYDGNTAYFTLNSIQSDFAAFANSFNQMQVANYLDFHSLSPTPELQDLITDLQQLTTTDLDTALNQMTGEIYGTTAQLQIQNALMMQLILRQNILGGNQNVNGFAANASPAGRGRVSNADVSLVKDTKTGQSILLIHCLENSHDDQWRGWMSGYGLGGNAESDGNAGGSRYGIGGTLFGLDRDLDSIHTIGMFGSYAYMDLKTPSRNQSVISNAGQFGGYGIRDLDWTYTLLSGAFGFNEYDSSRTVAVPGINATATADYNGWQSSTWLEQGLRFRGGNVVLQPFVALNYIYVGQNAFNESGAGVMNLAVDRIDANALRGVLGTSLSTNLKGPQGGSWTPTARAMWIHEFLDPTTSLNTTFASVGGPSFSTNGL
ncbi:MAG TPA: autotransporter domain-containing protein, partial [Planctomicrobium sp.]|nr:autotransporter domain-containing protein [Planctomicrobium sp.]